jgi:hypothetical protein
MVRKNLSFRSIAFQEKDDTFTGVCLDLDIIEEGHATLQEAILSVNDAISSHLDVAEKVGFPKELIERVAPKEYWDRLDHMVHVKPKTPRFEPFQFFTTPQYA